MSELAQKPSTIRLGDLEVSRLGFGAMRLPGKDVWGEPLDRQKAVRVVQRAVELGVNLIDTSWYYGPFTANEIIADALHPYPAGLVIATKLGGQRLPDKSWAPFNKPAELRQGCEHDLRTLRREVLDVVHLRYMPTAVSWEEQVDALIALRQEGKIRHIAVSNVSVAQVEVALARTPIVAVQNMFNVSGGRGALAKASHSEVESPEAVLALCEEKGIAYLPFFPLAVGQVGRHRGVVEVAQAHGATAAQIAIAWLLARSKVMLPIPGTGSLEHLEENCAAGRIALSADEVQKIAAGAR